MKQLLLFLSIIGLVSCGGPKAFYDYDEQMNFDECKTFSFYTDLDTGLSELDEARFIESLTQALINEGYQQSEDPDFKINFTSEFFVQRNNNTIGVGLGGGGRAVGGGISGGIPIGGAKQFVSITIEFANGLNNELFWQAIVESKFDNQLNPPERGEVFMDIAKKALENFPPDK